MDSIISKKLKGMFNPVILLRSDVKPDNVLELSPGLKGHCMMDLFARVVAEGETAVFARDSCGCAGAVVAMGFGNGYLKSPLGPKFYSAFFSKGQSVAEDNKQGAEVVDRESGLGKDKFVNGERLHESPEKAFRWITEELPVFDFPEKYAILKPLSQLTDNETPLSVIFTVNPLELSTLVILTGTVTDGGLELIAPPQASGCQTFGNYVFAQGQKDSPKPVLGLMDLAARPYIKEWIPDEYLTFSTTWQIFLKMEKAAEDGIFDGALWKYLRAEKRQAVRCFNSTGAI